MNTSKKIFLSLVLISCMNLVSAHSYWLEVKGSGKANEKVTVSLFFGEIENNMRSSAPYFLKNMESFSAWYIDVRGQKQNLKLEKDTNCYKASFMPIENGIYTVFMKEDVRDVQDWKQHGLGVVRPVEYLKTVYSVGVKSPIAVVAKFEGSKIDLLPIKAGSMQLLIDGKPAPKTVVSITYANKQTQKSTTDANGLIIIKKEKGVTLVDVDYKDNIPGSFKGKEYESIRYKYCLTIL